MSQYRIQYRVRHANVEGEELQVLIKDTFSGLANPYNINIQIIDAGGGNILVRVFFNNLPANATAVTIGYSADGGASWTNNTGGLVSPREFTIPNTVQYLYRLTVNYADGTPDETFYLSDLEGTITDWKPVEDPIRLIVNNNEENKMSPVAGTQLVLRVLADSNDLLNQLLRGSYSDRRYLVTADIGGRVIFNGWLQLGDTQEPFLPRPVIQFTATDALASLRSKPLKDADGNNPTGYRSLAQVVADCLRFTGLNQRIYIACNIREESYGTIGASPEDHLFSTIYLDPKTFEREIGESEDAYTVLTKVGTYLGRFAQRHGAWWFKNFDEFDDQPDYVAEFDADGEFLQMLPGAFYIKQIGRNLPIHLIGERAIVTHRSPANYARLNYYYRGFAELPCNNNFDRGQYLADETPLIKKYSIECWQLFENRPPVVSTTAQAFFRRIFNAQGAEIEAYAVIGVASATNEQQLVSEGIPVEQAGIVGLSFDVKYNGQVETGGGSITASYAQLRLYGDDGTYYTLEKPMNVEARNTKWIECDAGFSINQRWLQIEFNGIDDDTQWRTISLSTENCAAIPKRGYLRIVITHTLKVDQFELHVSPVRFEYYSLVNGVYQKYSGQYNKVSQTTDNQERIDDEIFITDSVARVYKGALLKLDEVSEKYILAGRFWNASVYINGVPDDTYYHPFGYIQAYNVWNQVRQLNRIMRATMQGIDSAVIDDRGQADIPTLFHTYRFTDADEHVNQKKFMLLSYEMSLQLCEWTGTFMEVHNEATGKKYSDPHQFKYIS